MDLFGAMTLSSCHCEADEVSRSNLGVNPLSLRGTLPSYLCEERSDEAISMAAIEIAAHLLDARNDKSKIVVCENRNTKM